jgi:hypothetical protein
MKTAWYVGDAAVGIGAAAKHGSETANIQDE